MKRIYIAGPMSGIKDHNFLAFDDARDYIVAYTPHIAISPANISRRLWRSWGKGEVEMLSRDATEEERKAYMKADLEALRTCNAIWMLRGWEKSAGAREEFNLACELGLDVYFEPGAHIEPTEIYAAGRDECCEPGCCTSAGDDYAIPLTGQDKARCDLAEAFAKAAWQVKHESSLEFMKVLVEAATLHAKKGQDYGSDKDPFANVKASEDFGVPGHAGCVIRANDKMRRAQSFIRKGVLANESYEDALIDLGVYAFIALVLYRQESAKASTNGDSV